MNLQCSQSTYSTCLPTYILPGEWLVLTLATLQLALFLSQICISGVAPDVIFASCVQLQYHVKLNRFLYFQWCVERITQVVILLFLELLCHD